MTAFSLGGPAARARIGGNALFDYAQIGWAVFDNTEFVGRASFVATTFGYAIGCTVKPGIVVSMANVLFGGSADFSDAAFLGPVNLAHVSAETGKVRWRWSQLEGKLRAQTGATLKDRPNGRMCFAIETAATDKPKDVQRRRAVAADTLRWIERNFKTQESLDDAVEAIYAREVAESKYAINDETSSQSARAIARARLGTWGWLFGFGVKPGRILAELVVVLIFAALVYGLSKREMGSDQVGESPIEWRSSVYPWRFSGSMYPFEGKKVLLAAWVSLAAMTTIRVKGAYIVLHQNDWLQWMVIAQRWVGAFLFLVLATSLASTMPVLHKALGWLPGF